MRILHLDTNHPYLLEQFEKMGFSNHQDYTSKKEEIEAIIHQFDGIVLRSRFSIDKSFLEKATRLKFIARVGAGLENIDGEYAERRNILLIAAPEGNRNAVGEHTLGLLLSLMNKINEANRSVKSGHWHREEHRGTELDGKTVGLIGYGNMGKAFAEKLRGFNVRVLCHDIKPNVGDSNAQQVSLAYLQDECDVLSLHTPETPLTKAMINKSFLDRVRKPIWFINTARGKSVVTSDLVDALKSGKVQGAGLDVLEYEKSSFENLFTDENLPDPLQYLIKAQNVILTPHVAGWTMESKLKLAKTIVDKVAAKFS